MLTALARARRTTALAALGVLTSACAFHNINLVQDTRISLVSPADGSTVTLPLTLRWKASSDIGSTGQRVQYAVFVDRTVLKPGKDLRSLLSSGDDDCSALPECPSTDYLNRHGVYVVDEPSAVIPRLPLPKSRSKRETHRLIVVILVDGKRQGEGAFARTVYLKNQT
jgi:hypothetical protein